MIKVEYLPLSNNTPLPDPSKSEWVFETHSDFKKWAQDYVCVYCLVDFYDSYKRDPKNLRDWMSKGCGCEVEITDEDKQINWDDEMSLPETYKDELEEHMQILADAFERHG